MDLFQRGFFTLHSGERSTFKIECDALTDGDIAALTYMLHRRLPVFSSVIGVPTGGLRIARAMEPYARPVGAPPLIIDDVYTSGSSMEAMRATIADPEVRERALGAVLFARRPVTQGWITALFTMAEEARAVALELLDPIGRIVDPDETDPVKRRLQENALRVTKKYWGGDFRD